jgi:hypothetical protein
MIAWRADNEKILIMMAKLPDTEEFGYFYGVIR